MKAKPPCTETLLNDAQRNYPGFKTCGDAVLEKMIASAELFRREFTADNSSARWLSFVGNSGTGKTFLSEMIYGDAQMCANMVFHRSLISGVAKRFWPKLVTRLRDGEFWQIDDLADANFVLLDEIAVEHDPSGFAKDKLCELLSRRVRKWAVLVSNLNLEKLGEIDARIPSRMIRDGSVTVDCSTQDYSLRKPASLD